MNSSPQKILILGATSAIAQAIARKFAGPKVHFLLAARFSALGSMVEDALRKSVTNGEQLHVGGASLVR